MNRILRTGVLLASLCIGAMASAQTSRPASPALIAARAAFAASPAYPTSEAHYAALKAKAGGGKKVGWDKLPDWSGVWETQMPDRADGETPMTQKAKIQLKPQYAAQYARLLQQAAAGKSVDHLTYCLPSGFPRSRTMPFLTEFTLTPERTLHIIEVGSEVRRIYTDGRPHMAEEDAYPLWSGDAIGFWDGSTLVVHTNHLREMESGYGRWGPPQSDQASTVERIWRAGPDEIISEITTYDPKVLTAPFRAVHAWRRVASPVARIDTYACTENPNAAATDEGTHLILPTEAGSGVRGATKETK
jgi:hypothetical protein